MAAVSARLKTESMVLVFIFFVLSLFEWFVHHAFDLWRHPCTIEDSFLRPVGAHEQRKGHVWRACNQLLSCSAQSDLALAHIDSRAFMGPSQIEPGLSPYSGLETDVHALVSGRIYTSCKHPLSTFLR